MGTIMLSLGTVVGLGLIVLIMRWMKNRRRADLITAGLVAMAAVGIIGVGLQQANVISFGAWLYSTIGTTVLIAGSTSYLAVRSR